MGDQSRHIRLVITQLKKWKFFQVWTALWYRHCLVALQRNDVGISAVEGRRMSDGGRIRQALRSTVLKITLHHVDAHAHQPCVVVSLLLPGPLCDSQCECDAGSAWKLNLSEVYSIVAYFLCHTLGLRYSAKGYHFTWLVIRYAPLCG